MADWGPAPDLAGVFDPDQHDYVSQACVHRRHAGCDERCVFCGAHCLCVCHRWSIPVESV